MKKRKCMSIEEHTKLGMYLYETRNELLDISINLSNNHYPKNSKAVRYANQVHERLDKLRCELDEQIFTDHGMDGKADIYYPAHLLARLAEKNK